MKTGILLINLGTPDSTSTMDVMKYHRQFFSDPRVIDTSWVGRQMLKYLLILPFRSPKTAALYREVWTTEGSPLLVYGNKVKAALQQTLGEKYVVGLGMGYGNPSVKKALGDLKKQGVKRLKIIPLFPQYASATSGSVGEAVMNLLKNWELIPETEFINAFYDDSGFIDAWVQRASGYDLGNYDHIIFSYHGLPERHILKADVHDHCLKGSCCEVIGEKNFLCYRAQCFATTRLIAERLHLDSEKYSIGFQSRFGKTPWLQPYLDDLIIDHAQKDHKKLLVFPPSFVADCIETIHEIGIEYAEVFTAHGGEQLDYVESLNDHPAWIAALKKMIVG